MLQLCAFLPPAINFCRSIEKFSQVYWAIIDIVNILCKHSSKHFVEQFIIQDWKDLLALWAFQCLPHYINNQVMRGFILMCKCIRFFKFFLSSFVGTIANIYLAEKKLGIANWTLDGKKTIFQIIAFIVKRMTGK